MRRPEVEDYLATVKGVRGVRIREFHDFYLCAFNKAAGSSHNHQAWEGGYRQHLTQCFTLANTLTNNLWYWKPSLDIYDSTIVVIYFHDIEKMFTYGLGLASIDKDNFLNVELKEKYGIEFSEEEKIALKYIHGEGNDYSGKERKMNELGAICHAADILSARVLYDSEKI